MPPLQTRLDKQNVGATIGRPPSREMRRETETGDHRSPLLVINGGITIAAIRQHTKRNGHARSIRPAGEYRREQACLFRMLRSLIVWYMPPITRRGGIHPALVWLAATSGKGMDHPPHSISVEPEGGACPAPTLLPPFAEWILRGTGRATNGRPYKRKGMRMHAL